jgi:hypothetical protein
MRLRAFTTVTAALALSVAAAPAASAADSIFTVAGNGQLGYGGDGGPALSARLNHPRGLVAVPGGGYLIADATAEVVRRVFPNGRISTIAGSGKGGFAGDGQNALRAKLNNPHAVAILPNGTVLIADAGNNRIRAVTPDGVIHTVAGTGVPGFSGDGGQARSAKLKLPRGIAAYSDGSYLIADSSNNRVRKVSPSGIITTVAGSTSGYAGDGGPALAAKFRSPYGVSILGDGGYLISDADNARVRRVSPAGIISTVAGVGSRGFSGDGGPGTSAHIGAPYNTAPLPGGGFLIADTNNNRVREVNAFGTIFTVAGSGPAAFSGDGGPATSAALNNPKAVLPVTSGFLVADSANSRIREVTSSCLVDHNRPASYFTRASRNAKRHHGRFTLKGTDKDTGCGQARTIKRLGISIQKIGSRGKCRSVRSNGRLGKSARCSKRSYVKAKLLSHSRWSYKLKRSLPHGRYIVTLRAVDRAGNLERRRTRGSKRNVIRFKA